MKKWLKFLLAIIISFLAGAIGAIFTSKTVSTWYLELNKPFFNPPGWVFGPVWNILFLLIGISLYLVWDKLKKEKLALTFFSTQWVLNIAWSFLFFYLEKPLYAFIEIILLWTAILFTIIYFYKINKKAGYLLIPYLAWVTFAAILNLSIVLLN